MAFCALIHTYMPDKIDFTELKPGDRNGNCACAARAAEFAGLTLNFVSNSFFWLYARLSQRRTYSWLVQNQPRATVHS